MSKILYLLPLYGGCPEYLMRAIQTKQTEVMREVTGRRWIIPGKKYVSTEELLKECGWLSVRQLSYYTTVLNVQKTSVNKNPEHIYEILTRGRERITRGSVKHSVKRTCVDEARLNLASSSFRWRGHKQHSALPDSLKDEGDLKVFKSALKSWVQENVLI